MPIGNPLPTKFLEFNFEEFNFDKDSPDDVTAAVLTGIEADQEDIFPDPMSNQLYAAWKQDHKAIEKQFAAM